MTEISKQLFDFGVHRQVSLQRYGSKVVRDIIALLNDAEADVLAQIAKRGERGPWTTARLKALFTEIGDMTFEAYMDAGKKLTKEMRELADHEAETTAAMLETQVPASFSVLRPSAAQLAAIVAVEPITVGADKKLLLEEIFQGLAKGKEEAIRGAIRLGIVEGQTNEQIIRRLRGTRAAKYADGILDTSRRHAASIVRTTVTHVSNQASQTVYKENADLVPKWVFTATLDSKVSLICASLSNTEWPTGEGPIPPRHVNCRSVGIPKMKTWRELGIDLDEMPPSFRASKDGLVKADITFNDWLNGQPVAVQKDILGATRQKLFAKGKMPLERFTDKQGVVYDLKELRERNSAAFTSVFGTNE